MPEIYARLPSETTRKPARLRVRSRAARSHFGSAMAKGAIYGPPGAAQELSRDLPNMVNFAPSELIRGGAKKCYIAPPILFFFGYIAPSIFYFPAI